MGITLTRFRRTLAEQIDHVRSGGAPVVIFRFGRPAAALVSIEDLDRIWMAEEDMLSGPVMEATGQRPGQQLWPALRKRLGIASPDTVRGLHMSKMRPDTAFKDEIE